MVHGRSITVVKRPVETDQGVLEDPVSDIDPRGSGRLAYLRCYIPLVPLLSSLLHQYSRWPLGS